MVGANGAQGQAAAPPRDYERPGCASGEEAASLVQRLTAASGEG